MKHIQLFEQFINERDFKVDNKLVGKTIIVLKEILLIQETEESNGERTLIRAKTQLVIFMVGENNPYVVLSIAKIFWKEKKIEKARKWFIKNEFKVREIFGIRSKYR